MIFSCFGLVRIGDHLLDGFALARAQHHQAHGKASCLAGHCVVTKTQRSEQYKGRKIAKTKLVEKKKGKKTTKQRTEFVVVP